MTSRPIGYYVHHHGAGHIARANAIAGASAHPIVLLGTGIGSTGIDLPDDRAASGLFDGDDGACCRPDALHYAPLDHQGIRSRVSTIARWIETDRPALMVVDVSVEVALLARLASVPVVYVRLNGDRNDAPHLQAFRGAVGLLAPYHEDLDTPLALPWVRAKTRFFPGITPGPLSPTNDRKRRLLVVFGRGGEPGHGTKMAQAAAASPNWNWRVIGPCTQPSNAPDNLEILGWVQNPEQEIADATLVVGAAGDGLVTNILATDRPFVCIAENRPFGEQRATAQQLGAIGAALVLSGWPEPQHWHDLIGKALAMRPEARRRLHDPDGARAAARWLVKTAGAPGKALDQAA